MYIFLFLLVWVHIKVALLGCDATCRLTLGWIVWANLGNKLPALRDAIGY